MLYGSFAGCQSMLIHGIERFSMGPKEKYIFPWMIFGLINRTQHFEIGSSPWVSFTAESSNYKFFLRAIGRVAFLGVLTDPYVDLELLRLIIGPAVDSILQIIQQWSPLKRPQSQFSPLSITQKDLDDILSMKK